MAAGEENFECHKIVLSACSPYFRDLFSKTKCRHPVIYLNDVPPGLMALLLRYMYVGSIAVKKEVIKDNLIRIPDNPNHDISFDPGPDHRLDHR